MTYKYPDPLVGSVGPDDLSSGESTLSRRMVAAQSVSTGNQSLRLVYFTAKKTETISQVRLPSGNTAAGATPTLVRIGIYEVDSSGNLALVGSTASDTTLFAATTTEYIRSLSASFTKKRGTRYAVGILVVTSATAPTLMGQNTIPAAAAGRAPRLAGLVSGQSDLPAAIAVGSITDQAHQAYIELLP